MSIATSVIEAPNAAATIRVELFIQDSLPSAEGRELTSAHEGSADTFEIRLS